MPPLTDSSPGAKSRVLRVVAIASRTGRYGGPFDTATRQTEALRAQGYDARMLAGVYAGDAPDEARLAPGRYVRVRALLPRRRFVSTVSLNFVKAACSEVRRASAVHVSFAREPIPVLTALIAIALRRPLILQPHGMLTARSTRMHRFVDRVLVLPLLVRSSGVVALSEVEAEDLAELTGDRLPAVQVLGNPLPEQLAEAGPEQALPADEDVRVLFVARLHPRKRVTDFLGAAHEAHASGRRWNWIVVGPDEGDLQQVEAAQAANPMLHYLGAVSADEVIGEVRRATVFVLPSEREPWGNVLATAIALGVPVVVTRSAALAAAVDSFGAGIVVPEQAPAALLDAVAELIRPERYVGASRGALAMRAQMLDPWTMRRRLVETLERFTA